MPRCRMSSFHALPGEVEQRWFHVDAADRVLGRLATQVATVLMGKHKPQYTPNVDTGDFVVVTNAEKIRVTGRKEQTKSYQRYSYYPGGHKIIPLSRVRAEHPTRLLMFAVRRMLPKNALGRKMLKKLKVYAGTEHPHSAQCPEPLAV